MQVRHVPRSGMVFTVDVTAAIIAAFTAAIIAAITAAAAGVARTPAF